MLNSLLRLKSFVQEKEWIKGSFSNGKGYCLVGSMMETHTYDEVNKILSKEVVKRHPDIPTDTFEGNLCFHIPLPDAHLGDPFCKLDINVHFNDHLAESKEDIISLIDSAIQELGNAKL